MNLFVGNINPVTTAAGLRQLFSEFGEVVSSKILMDNVTGQPRGFGFVEMADRFHSFDAIDNLDATFFEGNVISVKEAKQNDRGGGARKPGGNRMGGSRPGGGFNSRPGGSGNFNSRPGGGGNFNRPGSGSYSSDRPSGGSYNSDRPSGGSYNSDRPNGGSYNSDRPAYRPRPVQRPDPNTNVRKDTNDDDDRFNRL